MAVPLWLQAGFWGLVSGMALLVGAAIGYYIHASQRLVATIMAFGSGVLISALSLDLMNEAFESGGFLPTAVGFISGALIYTVVNKLLERFGAEDRKKSGTEQAENKDQPGNSLAIAAGALLDGIPESIVIGVSLIGGSPVNLVAVVAIFLSNFPEGLSSAAGMRKAGRSPLYVFGVWGSIVAASAIAAVIGYTVFSNFSIQVIAATSAVAAGAILTMLADTMLPEAFEYVSNFTGLIVVIGFIVAFFLSKLDK